jgi:nicotinate-nucleotide adenylyltransferase
MRDLELAREVRAALDLAAVRFIPAGDPPHRAAPVETAMHRLAMVELAIAAHPGLEVDPREIQRRGRSYTVETLEELRIEAPERALALIVGADAFLGFPTWHRWRELFDFAHVVVVARPGVAFERALPPPLAAEWVRRFRDDASALSTSPPGDRRAADRSRMRSSASSLRRSRSRAEGAVRGLLPAAVLAVLTAINLSITPGCDLTRSENCRHCPRRHQSARHHRSLMSASSPASRHDDHRLPNQSAGEGAR